MEILTINEAAHKLGIKKESVYKRIQRKTLEYYKDQDGRLYVYLDNDSSVEEPTRPPSNGQSLSARLRSFFVDLVIPIAGIAVGSAAALAALFYVLGYVTLWLPISRTYTHDWDSAWYAVSLVPNTVVVGLGAGRVLAVPALIVSTLFIFVIWALSLYAGTLYLSWRFWGRKGVTAWLVCLGVVVTISHLSLSWPDIGLREAFSATIIAIAAIVGMPMVVWRNWDRRAAQAGQDLSRVSHWWIVKHWWRALAIFTLFLAGCAFIYASGKAALSAPALPTVSISAERDIEGDLLAHKDGFWYVFNEEHVLVAISDKKVDSVRVPSRGD
jgi:excisionase family DNA binding protein